MTQIDVFSISRQSNSSGSKKLKENDASMNAQKGKTRVVLCSQDINREIQNCRDEQSERFDLSKSSVTILPSSIKEVNTTYPMLFSLNLVRLQLTHVRELYLYSNRIQQLPPEIGYLVNLKVLALSENLLTTLPETMDRLVHLKVLDLRHNRFYDVSSIECRIIHVFHRRLDSRSDLSYHQFDNVVPSIQSNQRSFQDHSKSGGKQRSLYPSS
jgi:Leucine-rich repeat (LRR) protein